MSAIADFTVAVLDCPTCCRHFIENRVVLAVHRHRVACPHCGAHYGAPGHADATPHADAGSIFPVSRPRMRNRLHPFGPRRRKLQ